MPKAVVRRYGESMPERFRPVGGERKTPVSFRALMRSFRAFVETKHVLRLTPDSVNYGSRFVRSTNRR